MNKAGLQYIQLVYFYRLLLVRYLVLFNLVSLLAENLQEEDHSPSNAGAGQDPSLGENENSGEPPLEPADCFEKGRIGQQVTGKELDEETGLMYFGARYYDAKISSWISTDPAMPGFLPEAKDLFFPEKRFDPSKLKGNGGVYNTVNINIYNYVSLNPIKYVDPDGNEHKIYILKVSGSFGFGAGGDATSVIYIDPQAKQAKITGSLSVFFGASAGINVKGSAIDVPDNVSTKDIMMPLSADLDLGVLGIAFTPISLTPDAKESGKKMGLKPLMMFGGVPVDGKTPFGKVGMSVTVDPVSVGDEVNIDKSNWDKFKGALNEIFGIDVDNLE